MKQVEFISKPIYNQAGSHQIINLPNIYVLKNSKCMGLFWKELLLQKCLSTSIKIGIPTYVYVPHTMQVVSNGGNVPNLGHIFDKCIKNGMFPAAST